MELTFFVWFVAASRGGRSCCWITPPGLDAKTPSRVEERGHDFIHTHCELSFVYNACILVII